MKPTDYRIPRAKVDRLSEYNLCNEVVEPVWPDVEEEDEIAHIEKATPGQRAICATKIFAFEVDNGGIKQFLTNSSGMYYQHVLDGLQALKATSYHEALSRFLGFFPQGKSLLDRYERQLGIAAMSDEQMTEITTYEKSVYRFGGFETALVPF